MASGQAASALALLNLARAGDHSVSAATLYGGTYNLFAYTLQDLGITVDFVSDPDDLDEWRRAVRPNTKAFYAESVGNPLGNVLVVAAVAEVAHSAGVPLVVPGLIRLSVGLEGQGDLIADLERG